LQWLPTQTFTDTSKTFSNGMVPINSNENF
jgi:hypothetical protein